MIKTRLFALSGLLVAGLGLAEASDPPAQAVVESHVAERRADEAALNEDPEVQRDSLAQISTGDTPEDKPPIELYGSVRAHVINLYDIENANRSAQISDGVSRIGARAEWQFADGYHLFGRVELGFDLIEQTTTRGRSDSDEDKLERRLAFIGVEYQGLRLAYGKNWSSYYQIAGMTDRFAIFGGSASGVYNAGTAGENTGTGRAEEVLQGRLSVDIFEDTFRLKPFKVHFQYQRGQPIPKVQGERYDYSYGVSAWLEFENEFGIGLAYNRAEVDHQDNPALDAARLDDDSTAAAISFRNFGNRWYASLLFSRLRNMETTDENIYFNATGIEFFSQYEVKENWWLIGGGNWLEPDSGDERAGEYRVRYAVIGGRYTLDSFNRMLYVEYRIDDGQTAAGKKTKNEITVGIRWDFGY